MSFSHPRPLFNHAMAAMTADSTFGYVRRKPVPTCRLHSSSRHSTTSTYSTTHQYQQHQHHASVPATPTPRISTSTTNTSTASVSTCDTQLAPVFALIPVALRIASRWQSAGRRHTPEISSACPVALVKSRLCTTGKHEHDTCKSGHETS